MARKKLSNLEQVHGKVEDEKFIPRTLNQIFGDTGFDRYQTLDVDVYEKELDEMSMSDMIGHATRIGVIPVGDKNRLRKALVNKFHEHVGMYARAQFGVKQDSERIRKKIEKLMK